MYIAAKFEPNQSIRCKVMALFSEIKDGTRRHLGFANMKIFAVLPIKV